MALLQMPQKSFQITNAFTAQCLGLAEHSYPVATLKKSPLSVELQRDVEKLWQGEGVGTLVRDNLAPMLCTTKLGPTGGYQREITAKPGDDVTLQCRSPRDEAITLLEWSRPDLLDSYVFLYRNERSYENYQHPTVRGRVQLRDPEMKDGDVSV
eukprot:superscaffoldBa00011381_g25191